MLASLAFGLPAVTLPGAIPAAPRNFNVHLIDLEALLNRLFLDYPLQ